MSEGAEEIKNDNSLSMTLAISSMKKRWPRVKTMTTNELQERMMTSHDSPKEDFTTGQEGSLVILDARPVEEYAVSHLETAQRVEPDASDISTVSQDLIARTKSSSAKVTVVCYCSLGYRSSLYIDKLQTELHPVSSQMEFFNLEGSLFKWANEGRPYLVDNNNKPTQFVHPYNVIWGKVLNKPLRKSSPDC